ncbi:MAG: hypothetical protein GY820_23705 [Gammaproteobacteria bacterium]|nr:hypothetical protein [Gammaproteobacteria bacterium]
MEHLTEDVDRATFQLYLLGQRLDTKGVAIIAAAVNNSFNDIYDSGCHPL